MSEYMGVLCMFICIIQYITYIQTYTGTREIGGVKEECLYA